MGATQQLLASYGAAPFVGPLDGYTTNLSASWSISRRLLTSYTGPIIRVRRSSDSSEQDVGYTGSGALDTTALLAFVGGGNGFITKLYDQSGAAYDLVQATALNQPSIVTSGSVSTYDGKPAGLFDGLNQYMIAGSSLGITTATRITSARLLAVGSFPMVAVLRDSLSELRGDGTSGLLNEHLQPVSSFSMLTPTKVYGKQEEAALAYRTSVNGATDLTGTSTQWGATTVSIGARPGGSFFANMVFHETFIWNGDLGTANVNAVANNMVAYLGL